MVDIRINAAKKILDGHGKHTVEEMNRALRYLVERGDMTYVEAIILTNNRNYHEVVTEAVNLCDNYKGKTLIRILNPIFNRPEKYGEAQKYDATYIAIKKGCTELLSKVISNTSGFSEHTRKMANEYLFENKVPAPEWYEMYKWIAVRQIEGENGGKGVMISEPGNVPQNVSEDYEDKDSYQALNDLELGLRDLIEDKLGALSQNWWKERIPGDVQTYASQRKQDNERQWPWFKSSEYSLVYYINFDDYRKIISKRDNWREAFQDVFKDKSIIESKLRELEPIRKSIAHHRTLEESAKSKLRLYSKEILVTIRE